MVMLDDLFPKPRMSHHCEAGRHDPICLGYYGGARCSCEYHEHRPDLPAALEAAEARRRARNEET